MMIALKWKALSISEYCGNMYIRKFTHKSNCKQPITVHYVTYFYCHQQENETKLAVESLKTETGKGVSLKGNVSRKNSKQVWVTPGKPQDVT